MTKPASLVGRPLSIKGGRWLKKASLSIVTSLSTVTTLSTLLLTMSPMTAQAATTSLTYTRTYTVKPGDCLYDIARTFHISLSSLEAANPKVHNTLIYSGEKLSIPSKVTPKQTLTSSPKSTLLTQHLTQEILDTAYNLRGIHYRWGGTSPTTGFDCSGFIQYIFAAHGIHLPRTASEQSKVGRAVALGNLQPGDLMFFVDTYAQPTDQVTHVALYIGHGNVIESSSVKNQGVMVIYNILQNPWYRARYYGARDVVGS